MAIPAGVLLLIMTLLLNWLEYRELIYTQRYDDLGAYELTHWVREVETDKGPAFSIRHTSMVPGTFSRKIPDGVYRIMIFGGSYAMGSPYITQNRDDSQYVGYGGMGDWIKGELEMRHPNMKVEVLNFALGGNPSNGVCAIFNDVFTKLKIQTDLAIVATGNNEGFVQKTPFNDDLNKWIVYRGLKRVLLRPAKLAQRSYFTSQDPDTQKIQEQFQKNIIGIINVAKDKKVPLVLCTLPINLRYAGVDPSGGELDLPQNDTYIQKGLALQKDKKWKESIEEFQKSPNQAFSTRLIAVNLEHLKRFSNAGDFYKLHVQLYPKNRTRPSFNQFVREKAEMNHVPLADLERAAEKLSPHGLPGKNLFFDYCHMSYDGYYEMSQVILDRVYHDGFIKRKTWGTSSSKPEMDEIIRHYHWKKFYNSGGATYSP